MESDLDYLNIKLNKIIFRYEKSFNVIDNLLENNNYDYKKNLMSIYNTIEENEKKILENNIEHKLWINKIILIAENLPISLTIGSTSQPIGHLIYVNKAFEKLSGYKRSELMGNDCRILQYDKTNKEKKKAMSLSIKTANAMNFVIENKKKNGEEFLNLIFLKPIFNSKGEYCYIIGIQIELLDENIDKYEKEIIKAKDILSLFSNYMK